MFANILQHRPTYYVDLRIREEGGGSPTYFGSPILADILDENAYPRLGCETRHGTARNGSSTQFVDLGMVTSIEYNHKSVESARKGQEVCIKIEPVPGEAPKMFGRHFEAKDFLVSKISRQSIDACKDYFRDDLLKTDWQLMVELKKLFQIL
ncbi:unnamed protein product [Lasius platythorax]|uniref:Uncharacterized protein n=1 Tax=Lasius platythorax TaxID=488582 RepID=A0AAV2N666_9HYME